MFKKIVFVLLILSLVVAVLGLRRSAVVSPLSWRLATGEVLVNQYGTTVMTVDCRVTIEIEGVRKEVSVPEANWRICKMKTRPETIEVEYFKLFRLILVFLVEV